MVATNYQIVYSWVIQVFLVSLAQRSKFALLLAARNEHAKFLPSTFWPDV